MGTPRARQPDRHHSGASAETDRLSGRTAARGWEATVLRERAQLADLLAESPSLRQEVPAIIARRLPLARRIVARERAAHGEVPAAPPELDEARVLGEWLP
ncbi:MAG: DUF29 family protein [Acetobacteraceae bacterium]